MANPKLTIKGNLATDPEIITLTSTKKLKMRVITNDVYKDETGAFKNKDTSGWNIEAWGELAEQAYKALKKGDNVTIMGTIKERSYDDKEGNRRYVVEVKADSIALDIMAAARKQKVSTSASDNVWNIDGDAPF